MYAWITITAILAAALSFPGHVTGNHYAKKLYDDLLRKSGYNRIIRPVQNDSDVIIVTIGLKLSQLIDVVSGCIYK